MDDKAMSMAYDSPRQAGASPVFAGEISQHRFLNDGHSVSDNIDELSENLRHRLTLNGLNVGERYRHGDLNIVVALDTGVGRLELIFAALPHCRPEVSLPWANGDLAECRADCDQVPVFIDQIQVM